MPDPHCPPPLARVLELLAASNRQRLACVDEATMLQQQCRLLVEFGGYRSAKIRLALPAGGWQGVAEHGVDGQPAKNSKNRAQPASAKLTLGLDASAHPVGELTVDGDADFTAEERIALDIIAKNIGETLHDLRQTAANDQLQSSLRQLSRALESSLNGVMITSSTQLDHPIVYVNPAFERITGYSAEEVIGESGRFLVRDDLNQRGLGTIREALRSRREAHAILRNYRKDGSLFWNELFIAPVRDESGSMTTHFVSILNDVSERISYEQQLEFHANHDALTGLANRNLLNDRIAQALAQARADNLMVGVLLLDLDRFKLINDGFGHSPANELLKSVAHRLSQTVRDTDTVARLGGDEFVVVIGRLQSADDLSIVAGKILRSLNQPFIMEGKEIFVTASVGAALYPRDGDHGEILLRNADVAMYRVKEHGRNNYRFYTPEMTHMAIDRLDMEGNLRRALERDELQVYYQPLVDLGSGAIVGAEALVRWSHPRIGMIQPGEFIPLAEDTGLIIPLGQLVLRRVCTDIRDWQASGLPPIKISLNLSARQFRQDDLSACIREVLDETGVEGRLLAFELTESMVMHDVENTLDTLRELKALGATISLDDFGTGYSSLSYLKRFPIDTLKIDRSFVRDIHQDGDDAAIAHAVIAMAHKLGIKVIAEGVECPAQLDLLREFGCDELQGYYFSRPVPVEEFTLMLRQARSLADLERG
ncbi:putative bifunctional diguanylate cyclase/phosphodiesterase [Azonexus fungiphilus]|uniref:putative bifunctional diguanylate cyclase/phosphodiesterase n=1 Tax=Azonexus fungiphilus TaxID=146940 RepID=UPI00156BA7EE|nr:EAL domain-containing protein [Azonexus fungiphilus]NHC06099.1 EAL domain-containing protein [Azonexus fungiphilus]